MSQLQDIIEGDRIIFSRITESGEGTIVSARIFDFAAGEYIGEIRKKKFEDAHQLNMLIRKMLFGTAGDLFVDASGMEKAEIFLDGESYGFAPQTISELGAGNYEVRVVGPSGEEFTETVELKPDEPGRVVFTFQEIEKGSSGSALKYLPGAGLLAIGAAGVGFGVMQSLEVQRLNDNITQAESKPDVFIVTKDGRKFVLQDPNKEETNNAILDWKKATKEAQDSSAPLYQWVGYGVGAVGILSGSYLLYRAMQNGSESNVDVAINPSLSEPGASVRLRF